MKLCGIYVIHAPSGNQYVGSSSDILKRWSRHRRMFNRNEHSPRLQSAWRKYGNKLSFSVLLICSPADLLFYEQRAIDVLKPRLNTGLVAEKSQLGVKWSPSARARLKAIRNTPEAKARYRAIALARPPLSIDHRAKISAGVRKPEVLEKIIAVNVGKKQSAETKAKRAAALLGNTNSAGKHPSLETRAKMSASHLRYAAKRAIAMDSSVT